MPSRHSSAPTMKAPNNPPRLNMILLPNAATAGTGPTTMAATRSMARKTARGNPTSVAPRRTITTGVTSTATMP